MRSVPLSVGVPREIKSNEKRVGLTPEGVRVLQKEGVPVFLETGAGKGSGFPDWDYETAGAVILRTAREIYQQSEIIKKVKEPLPPKWDFLKEGRILFCFLHLDSPENRELLEVLLEKKVIGLGYETALKDGRTIFLEPMSEIAGILAALLAGFFVSFLKKGSVDLPPRFLEKLEGLAGTLPELPENLRPGKVLVFGGGTVGRKAAQTALKMGGEVDLIEKRPERRKELRLEFKNGGERFRVWGIEDDYATALKQTEVWVGAVHVVGKRAPLVISKRELEELSKGKKKLIIDIAVDQGGNFPETRPTTYEEPLYLDSFGNWRFAVANVPSLAGRWASEAIEKATLPYLVRLAKEGKNALRNLPELGTALQVFEGKLVNEAIDRDGSSHA